MVTTRVEGRARAEMVVARVVVMARVEEVRVRVGEAWGKDRGSSMANWVRVRAAAVGGTETVVVRVARAEVAA